MRVLLTAASCLAIGLAAMQPASAQGPVRQGLRRTGEIAVEGTRRVVQGTGEVVRGAGRAAVGVAEGAADVTRGVVRGTARGIGAGVNAITPNIPLQARAGANLQAGDIGREARWRFQQHNGEWWYYTPENAWMYHRDGQWNEFAQDSFQTNPALAGQANQSGQYSMGYRGVEGDAQYGAQAQGPAHTVYRDRYGREYICDNGHRVYVNSQQGQEYGAGNRGPEGQQFQGQEPMTPTPAISGEGNLQGDAAWQGQAGAAAQSGAPTQPVVPVTPSATVPATPQAGVGTSTDAAAGLAPESPRDINQTDAQTNGTVEAGETSR